MSVLTLSELETRARDVMRDTDSLNYAIDQTTLQRFINKAYVLLRGIEDNRPRFLSATATSLTLGNTDASATLAASLGIRRILGAWETGSAGSVVPAYPPLERLELWELSIYQAAETPAQPTHYCAFRAGTATAANVGAWTFMPLPISNTNRTFMLEALIEPTPLSGGTDKPDVDDMTSHAIADMAGAIGARILGLPTDYVASVEARIPQAHQAALNQLKSEWLIRQDAA